MRKAYELRKIRREERPKKTERDEKMEIGNSNLIECELEEPAVKYLSVLKNKDRNSPRGRNGKERKREEVFNEELAGVIHEPKIRTQHIHELKLQSPWIRHGLAKSKRRPGIKTRVVRTEQRGEEDEADSKNRNAIKREKEEIERALVTAARVKAKDFSDFAKAEARWEPKVTASSERG
ncbi:hypothetical protein G5I_13958 [Acromyrmex echinatior]|uniref:Uncharacterized protein n=1 Tax=Acromyrmex echinatior TaxID=103372 RepID=F4X6E0_ACREC|nr:hypothetical protein G5I_13958 [Acromyrmex echinatior]